MAWEPLFLVACFVGVGFMFREARREDAAAAAEARAQARRRAAFLRFLRRVRDSYS